MADIPVEELFTILDVEVSLQSEDMPGKPLHPLFCIRCGEIIKDGRKIEHQKELLCEPCFIIKRIIIVFSSVEASIESDR